VLLSCAPTYPGLRSWRGYAVIDSYASSDTVRLFWDATTDPGCIDFPCPPPGPEIGKVLLERSLSDPGPLRWASAAPFFSGWHVVSVGPPGRDSVTMAGLEQGRLYWFRVVALDLAGRQLLASNPIMTTVGPPSIPSVSVGAEMTGRFSWSPSGDSISFVDASVLGDQSLAVIDTRSLAMTHLVTYSGAEWISDARWSNDGSTLAFTHSPTRTSGSIDYRIWTLSLSNLEVATQTGGRVDFDPAWGRNEWIYFCKGTYEPPNIPEIWRVRSGDLSSMEAVTADPGVYKYSPSVRPSDDLVVYQGRPRKDYGTAGLYRVAPGGSPISLTPAGWYVDSSPCWSPDGQHVVFVSRRSGHSEAWSLDVESGALGQLTRGPRGTNILFACWSPNGQRLAVFNGRQTANGGKGQLEIYDTPAPLP
jgi:hypothetical protein